MARHQSIGLGVGIVAFFVFSYLFIPELACEDGWKSPSIGKQGACSHHGGVRNDWGVFFLVLSLSVVSGVLAASRFKPKNYPVVPESDFHEEKIEQVSSVNNRASASVSSPADHHLPSEKKSAGGFIYLVDDESCKVRGDNEVELIYAAIKEGKEIEFGYTKPRARVAELRQIKPFELAYVSNKYGDARTHCVIGFCSTRNAQRTFALKRMSNLRVL